MGNHIHKAKAKAKIIETSTTSTTPLGTSPPTPTPKQEQKTDDEKEISSVAALREALVASMAKIPVSELSLGPKPVILDAKADIKDGLQTLIDNKIRAAPVMDEEEKTFIGVLDVRDTLAFALKTYDKETPSAIDDTQESPSEVSEQLQGQTVRDYCAPDSFFSVKTSDSVLAAAQALAKGCHAIGVMSAEDENSLVSILTQGELFQQASKLWEQGDHKGMANVTLQQLMDLSFITSPVQGVSASTKARDVFSLMASKNLSGLAVTNNDGKLVHNTSATDIKLWLMAGSSTLNDEIERFLINIRKMSVDERFPVTMCWPKDTLKRAVGKLQATKYHRMWIIDEESRPIGVLALTDIFRFVCAKDEDKEAEPMTIHKRPKDDVTPDANEE